MKILKQTAHLSLALVAIAALAGSAALLTGCKHADADAHSSSTRAQYTCAMHPEVVSSTPGKCPKCGMDLEAKK
jgi:hypothetical protein